MKDFNLIGDTNIEIKDLQKIKTDDKSVVYKAKLEDGSTYLMPVDSTRGLHDILENLKYPNQFAFPQDHEGIRVYCDSIISQMTDYYTLKVFKRVLSFQNNDSEVDMDFINKSLIIFEDRLKNSLTSAAFLSRIWAGERVANFPAYHGSNPYNIFGVDHKYDYLLEKDQQYFKKRRDLILELATSRRPVTNITEQELIACTPLVNSINGMSRSLDDDDGDIKK